MPKASGTPKKEVSNFTSSEKYEQKSCLKGWLFAESFSHPTAMSVLPLPPLTSDLCLASPHLRAS